MKNIGLWLLGCALLTLAGFYTSNKIEIFEILIASETQEKYMNLDAAHLSKFIVLPHPTSSVVIAGTKAPKATGHITFPMSVHAMKTSGDEDPFDFVEFVAIRNLPAGSNITVNCVFASGPGGSEPVYVTVVGQDYQSERQEVKVNTPQTITFTLGQSLWYNSQLIFERESKASLVGTIKVSETMPRLMFDQSTKTQKCFLGGDKPCTIAAPFIHVVHHCPPGGTDNCSVWGSKTIFKFPFNVIRWAALWAPYVGIFGAIYIAIVSTSTKYFAWKASRGKIMI